MVTKPTSVEEYLVAFPDYVKTLLEELRQHIKNLLPEAEEKISYGIPSFFLHGPVVYYSGNKHHISIYPAPRDHPLFAEELTNYKGGKGTVQFPFNQPIPYDLVTRIVHFRAQENIKKKIKKKNGQL